MFLLVRKFNNCNFLKVVKKECFAYLSIKNIIYIIIASCIVSMSQNFKGNKS